MTEPEANTNESSIQETPQPATTSISNADAPPLFDLSGLAGGNGGVGTAGDVDSAGVPPKRTVRLWKPEGEEFTLDQDYAQLVVDLGEADFGVVHFEIVPEALGERPGHTLIASILTQI